MTQLLELAENINFLPGLIVSIFLVVIHVSALLALIGNIKIPQTQKLIRFKEKRVKLRLSDVPLTFDDWESHFGEYKELIKNYRQNYRRLRDAGLEETEEDRAIEREITPYNIMADVAGVVSRNERPLNPILPAGEPKPLTELRVSALGPGKESRVVDLVREARPALATPPPAERPAQDAGGLEPAHAQALFRNPELRDLFAQNGSALEQYEIMNRNRKKTNIANGAEMGDLADLKQQYRQSTIRVQTAEMEKERKLAEFATMFRDPTNQWKTIDPSKPRVLEPARPLKVSTIPGDSLNFFDDDEFTELDPKGTVPLFNGQAAPTYLVSQNPVPPAQPPGQKKPPRYNIFEP